MKCTRFKNIRNTKPLQVCDLRTVLLEIASDKYKTIILEIRKDENPTKSPLKNKLPVFTPTGIFKHRSIQGLTEYNGNMCLDIDNIAEPEILKNKCKQLDYVYCAFVTPSGKGLKVIIKTDANIEDYTIAEILISDKFLEDTGAKRDNRCKDISRIQFVSHDPYIYINENSKILTYK